MMHCEPSTYQRDDGQAAVFVNMLSVVIHRRSARHLLDALARALQIDAVQCSVRPKTEHWPADRAGRGPTGAYSAPPPPPPTLFTAVMKRPDCRATP